MILKRATSLLTGYLKKIIGHYSCTQENELANKKRTDILMQNHMVASPVPNELKLLNKKWTGSVIFERLCNQIAGDYIREETARCGILLLVWQGNSSQTHWKIYNQKVTLQELNIVLKAHWNHLAAFNFPEGSVIEVTDH